MYELHKHQVSSLLRSRYERLTPYFQRWVDRRVETMLLNDAETRNRRMAFDKIAFGRSKTALSYGEALFKVLDAYDIFVLVDDADEEGFVDPNEENATAFFFFIDGNEDEEAKELEAFVSSKISDVTQDATYGYGVKTPAGDFILDSDESFEQLSIEHEVVLVKVSSLKEEELADFAAVLKRASDFSVEKYVHEENVKILKRRQELDDEAANLQTLLEDTRKIIPPILRNTPGTR